MAEERNYFKNYPQEDEENNKVVQAERTEEEKMVSGESFTTDIYEQDTRYEINEAGEYIIAKSQMKEEEAEESSSYDSHYQDYTREAEYAPYNRNEEYSGFSSSGDFKPRKKKSWGKRIGFTFAGIAAAVLIAFSSIGVYSTFFEDKGDNGASTVAQEESNQTVQQTTSSGIEMSVADINTKVAPSVVGITGQSSQGEYVGTGIIMTEDGYIMTNAHVVNGMGNLTVTLNDGSEESAELIGLDTQTDLAIIKINKSGLTAAEFGDSDTLKVGQEVVAIGNPLGLDFAGSVTTGIISGLDREVDMGDAVMNYIQTNAAINSGNSGGPLVNSEGQVIGVNSAKISTTVAEGMGFAIPINDALPIVNELIENGYVSGRPMIGIAGEDIDESTAAYNRVPTGVYVTSIDETGAAAGSGLEVGDIITQINGVDISSISQLNSEKNKYEPGDTVELTYYRMRTGETNTVKVELTENTGDE